MEFAVFATWDHGSSIPAEVVARIVHSLPPEGRPCVVVDPQEDRYLTLGLDVNAPSHDEATVAGRAALERAVRLGPLAGRVIRVESLTEEGHVVWPPGS
jgi:hypothetical protein